MSLKVVIKSDKFGTNVETLIPIHSDVQKLEVIHPQFPDDKTYVLVEYIGTAGDDAWCIQTVDAGDYDSGTWDHFVRVFVFEEQHAEFFPTEDHLLRAEVA